MDKAGVGKPKTGSEKMNPEKYLQLSGCNCPELNTIKIVEENGIPSRGISLPESVAEKLIVENCGNGLRIEVKANCEVELPLQIMNLMSKGSNTGMVSSNSIKLNAGARLKLLHCDDSMPDAACNQTNSLDVEIGRGAALDYYKLENINDFSTIDTTVNFTLERDASLKTFGLSLNGKRISNKINVKFLEEGGRADLNGLYLMDKQQHSLTEVDVHHSCANCYSEQLFKGIVDDSAKADFLGHIFVDYGACGTQAMQNSKNMQLTDKSKVNTRPFLEIYNDDVKCSHGATVGQLDKEALFYLRTRGISSRSAKMLLMYAFCEEVLSKSDIKELKESLGDLIKRRLQGELTSCGDCVFQCSKAKNEDIRE